MPTHTLPIGTLLALVVNGVGAEELLCADLENPIAEDMRILESDLTYDRSQKALETLRDSKPNSGDMEFAYRNSAKIVQGYALRQVALSTRSADTIATFCSWLIKEGFWYD